MVVKVLDSYDKFQEVINSGKPVLIDFWAAWCGPCKAISPVFEKLSNEVSADVEFYKVDVDDQNQISQEALITAMPTFILFQNGKKIKELVGANPAGLQDLISVGASLT